jgi:hypothetical protein
VEDFYTGNFAKAVKLWSSVDRAGDSRLNIPINRYQREQVYSISAEARILKPMLDGLPNTGWKIQSCNQIHICDESGPWFTWELRDASESLANVHTEREFQDFFGKIAVSIENACHVKRILCRNQPIAPGSRPIQELNKKKLFSSLLNFSVLPFKYPGGTNIATPDNKVIGSTTDIYKEWHRVVRYSVPTKNSSMLKLFKYEYLVFRFLVPFLFIWSLARMLLFKYFKVQIWEIFMIIYGLLSLFLNALGISIFEQSLGFNALLTHISSQCIQLFSWYVHLD